MRSSRHRSERSVRERRGCSSPGVTNQVVDLDALIAPDHPARLVWSFVTSLELGELYASIKACRHTVGRTPIDPRLLLALWLYAVIDGVGSAREIVRCATSSIAGCAAAWG